MIDLSEVLETNKMVEEENLDVRTITLGISLLDCADDSVDACCEKIYNKITTLARDLVRTGEEISREIGIPIVHKRISVTPISLIGASCCHTTGDFVKIAQTLDRAAAAVGVNFLGGFSALVSKGMPHPLHSTSSGHDRPCLLKRQRGQHQERTKHGRRETHGRDRAPSCRSQC